jgi:hypothetical protein
MKTAPSSFAVSGRFLGELAALVGSKGPLTCAATLHLPLNRKVTALTRRRELRSDAIWTGLAFGAVVPPMLVMGGLADAAGPPHGGKPWPGWRARRSSTVCSWYSRPVGGNRHPRRPARRSARPRKRLPFRQ